MNFQKFWKTHKKGVIGVALVAVLIIWLGFIKTGFFPFIFQLAFNSDINLKHTDDHINVLLLGIGGEGHDGPNLTDTMIFASIDQAANKVTLISIPRDLWVPDLNDKINSAYSFGESKHQGSGLVLAKSVVSNIINQPIDYSLRINFEGFVRAVDLISGLDIDVARAFDDYEYPIDGKENDSCGFTDQQIASFSAQIASGSATEPNFFPCRYMHIRFDQGKVHMDGKTALEFVRSRHAQGDEGTDFARSARQEKIIKAFKDKVLSAQTIFNPFKLLSLYATVRGNVDTDIQPTEMDDFIRLAQKLKPAKVKTAVLDYGDREKGTPGLLINPPITADYGFAWVLIPRIGIDNYGEIQEYIKCVLKNDNCQIPKTPKSPR